VDDQTKAKALMAAGLFILAAIGLIVVLVVLPAVQGSRPATAVAQEPGGPPASPGGAGTPGMPGMPGGSGMPGGPGMPGGAGMPGMPGGSGMPGGAGMPGMPGATGAPAAAGGAPAAAAAPAKVVDPLEPSRENPFAPMGAVTGVESEEVRTSLAFQPKPTGMPIALREQNRYPSVGPNGESIRVPSGAPSRQTAGPALPPGQRFLRVSAIMRDPQGRAMVLLQARPGEAGAVLRVGDLWQGYRVERITNTEMVLAKEEDGKTVREVVRLQVGGTRGGTRSGTGRPGVSVPGARPGGQPDTAGGGGAPTQPGIRRPGGARPGAFPGAGGGQQ